MTPTFSKGDVVECIKDCDNGNGQFAEKGKRYTVEFAGPHPLFTGITFLFLEGKSKLFGFHSNRFRKANPES